MSEPSRHTPSWCEHSHLPDDHPEMRYHEQIIGDFAAVLGEQPDLSQPPIGTGVDVIVRRLRFFDSPSTWVSIEREDRGEPCILMQQDAAIQLHHALSAVTRDD